MLRRSGICWIGAFWKTKVDPNSPKFAAIPRKIPYTVALEEGKQYFWCSCGLSSKQPFCDGTHKKYNEEHKTQFKSIPFTAPTTKKYLLCACKQSDNKPFCDLSHIGVMFRTAVGIDKDPKP